MSFVCGATQVMPPARFNVRFLTGGAEPATFQVYFAYSDTLSGTVRLPIRKKVIYEGYHASLPSTFNDQAVAQLSA